jgi:hypothetical protein
MGYFPRLSCVGLLWLFALFCLRVLITPFNVALYSHLSIAQKQLAIIGFATPRSYPVSPVSSSICCAVLPQSAESEPIQPAPCHVFVCFSSEINERISIKFRNDVSSLQTLSSEYNFNSSFKAKKRVGRALPGLYHIW